MEIVTILRDLWRLRLLVVLIACLAALAGLAVAYRISPPTTLESRKYEVGVASARILVDTPRSQVVEVAPEGSDALGVRANLLANLMVAGELKTAIAERAGLKPEELVGVSQSTADPIAAATPIDPRGYVLSTNVLASADGERLPIIEVEAQAPDAARAARLAEAAVAGLGEYLDSKAAAEQVSPGERLRVSGLGAPQARQAVRGPRTLMAVGVSVFIFLAGCTVILLLFALVRGWRALSTQAHFGGGDLSEDNLSADTQNLRELPRPAPPLADDDVRARSA